jgi:hypothetical protein
MIAMVVSEKRYMIVLAECLSIRTCSIKKRPA